MLLVKRYLLVHILLKLCRWLWWRINTSSTSANPVTYSSNDPNVLSGNGSHGGQDGANSYEINSSYLSLFFGSEDFDAIGKGGGGGGNMLSGTTFSGAGNSGGSGGGSSGPWRHSLNNGVYKWTVYTREYIVRRYNIPLCGGGHVEILWGCNANNRFQTNHGYGWWWCKFHYLQRWWKWILSYKRKRRSYYFD